MSNKDVYFKDITDTRDNLTKRQQKEIRKFYSDWSKEVKSQVEGSNISSQQDLAKLYYSLRNSSRQLSAEINNEVVRNAGVMGDVVVRTNQRWLKSLGMSTDSLDYRLSAQKDIAIRSIITGNLYQDGKPLNKTIWNITDSNIKDINSIISKGIVLNYTADEIARQLERYLNPTKLSGSLFQKYTDANGKTFYMHLKNRQPDWRAQRLARTVLQHAYQQSLVLTTKDNPFVTGYIWHSNGANACPICIDRDGQFYKASELPLDHPNGQCDFEVAIDEEKARNDIIGFLNNPIEYPDIQRYLGE